MDKVGYKIWCEWDMGMNWENKVFLSKESAEKDIKEADWKMVSSSLKEVKKSRLVSIQELEIIE